MKVVELVFNPLTGVLQIYDQCRLYRMYGQFCEDFLKFDIAFNFLKFFVLFYNCYLAKSLFKRLERGELILCSHGRQVVDLINQI